MKAYLQQPYHITYNGFDIILASSPQDYEAYWKLATELMFTERYGLQSLDFLKKFETDYLNHLVILVRETTSHKPVAAMKAVLDYDLSQYQNLNDFIQKYWQRSMIVQTSNYTVVGLDKDVRLNIFEGMFGLFVKVLLDKGYSGAYAEVPASQANRAAQLGYYNAGTNFIVEGWNGEWAPILCNFRSILTQHTHPSFQEFWLKKTGETLCISMWQNINRICDTIETQRKVI